MHDDSTIIEKEKAHARYISAMTGIADTTAIPEVAFVAIRWAGPTNDFERMPEFITRQCERWKGHAGLSGFPESICAIAHKDRLPYLIGDTIPDVMLPMHNGDTTGLHALLGAKLTILDLWASWCAPCRKENREVLAPIMKQYRDQGLQIIGYALDSEHATWIKAIDKDQANWAHASHLAGDGGPFVEALRISTIPANYILDQHGVILARNLHGNELTTWLREAYR
jgi:thiol-disulfide isomerase/thioredoxin